MAKLKPMYLYRLRLVAQAPRFYSFSSLILYLERRGLIARTGRTQPDSGRIEYEITSAGRDALGRGSEQA